MPREHVVNLSSNGDYWQADWIDVQGKRRKRSLGPKGEVSRRQAKKLCRDLQNAVNRKPGAVTVDRAPGLAPYVQGYIDSRTDLKAGTLYLHRLTKRYLTAFFGEQTRIDQITRASAREWQLALTQGRLSDDLTMAPATVRGHIVNAKAIFQRAVDDDLILFNPFDRITVSVPKVEKDWHYVTIQELDKLLEACKTVGWKALIALCRLAGLRRGEALALRWSSVDWQKRWLTVYAEKTATKRVVPIDPRLYPILLEAFEQAGEGQERVCAVNQHCLWRNFTVIRKRAELSDWDDAFQVMRRNCETDWAGRFPQHAVSEWLGHDIRVSAEHYLAVPEELYKKASKPPPKPKRKKADATIGDQSAPKSAPKPPDTS